ncbi:HD domain-containing protein [Calditrichota bacterium]
MMNNLEEKAKKFATERHSAIGQVRKYTGEPYINHPAAVVEIVRSVQHTEEMLAAAWLHDTVEDTETQLPEIANIFGDNVAYFVFWITDVSKSIDGNRVTRKALDRKHIAAAPPQAKTIKLADLIDNSKSIIERNPKFARVYLAEKALLLEVLKEGDKTLWNQANDIVQNASFNHTG